MTLVLLQSEIDRIERAMPLLLPRCRTLVDLAEMAAKLLNTRQLYVAGDEPFIVVDDT
jgi:hypothetical protein